MADTFIERQKSQNHHQWYSKELAHVVTSLAGKAWEEHGSLRDSIVVLGNGYVLRLERDVCLVLAFDFPRDNLLTVCHDLCAANTIYTNKPRRWGNTFFELAATVAINTDLITIHPCTIILACKLLHDRGKLRCANKARENRLWYLINRISKEWEIEKSQVIQAFITCLNPDYVDDYVAIEEPASLPVNIPLMIPPY